MRYLILNLILCLLPCAFSADAQEPGDIAPLGPAETAAEAVAEVVNPTDEEGPVPVPEPTPLAVEYRRGNDYIWIFETLLGFIVPALLLFTGFSGALQRFSQRIGKYWWFTIAIYVIVLSTLLTLLELPWSYYTGFVRQHAYGISNQTFGKWSYDTGVGFLVELVVTVLIIWIPYLLIKKSPTRWWLYVSLLIPVFFVLTMLIVPVYIDPLFNEFGPMQNKELEAEILDTADSAGIEGSRVYEVKKSVDTKAVNAYVTGMFGTKRIVLWDTLLQKLNEREVVFVMGHEMGHYVLHHVWKTVALVSTLMILALYLTYRISNWMIAKYQHRFGFSSLAEIGSLPLLMLVMGLLSFVITPGILAYSRHNEHEADRFALELLRDNRNAATAFVKLQTENLGIPRVSWWAMMWRGSHPTIEQRINFMNAYKPWETGEEMKYEHHFKNAQPDAMQ